ncbi:MAG: hypothetical protein Q9163_003580 [Psora crenata]
MAAIFQRHPRKIIAGGVAIACIAFSDYLPNPFRTPGVKNIEQRYSSGGGTQHSTPGTATKRGNPDHVEPNVEKSKAIGTPYYDEKIGDQRPGVGEEAV